MAATPRFFAKESCGINENEFLDWTKPLVHTASDVDDRVVKQINLNPMSGFIANFRQNKIDEMKETSSNRDFSQGSTASGVTSGAAIATLQEAGNKTSRDMINASYRCYARIAEKIIDRMRQFYDERRCFRITGEAGAQTKYRHRSTIRFQRFRRTKRQSIYTMQDFSIRRTHRRRRRQYA